MSKKLLIVAVAVAFVLPSRALASGYENKPPQPVAFTVINRSNVVSEVAGLKWSPVHADSVILAVHGSSGGKEVWGALPDVAGYSFGHRRAHEGRAVIAIDLPSYGASAGDNDLEGMEDFAFVVAQIAQQLRAQYAHVIGAGLSMGAGIVEIAQGLFHSFDALIAASWSHGGYNPAAVSCFGGGPCPDLADQLWLRSNADPRVIDDVLTKLPNTILGPFLSLNIALYGGSFTRPTIGPSLDDVTASITVPIFILFGARDWVWDDSKLAAEPSHFPLDHDVKLTILPDTGHMVFHHLNYDAVESSIGTWLDARRF